MANIKSAIKRIGTSREAAKRNKSAKSELATLLKKFKSAIENKEMNLAAELKNVVFSKLDSLAGDNIIHANKAAREKARVSKMLDNANKA
ncbi:MAG: 30S ribosomal protein S20 [Christensenellaceae bacterium]|jgi:small subunit ribosomal protein S20|nr:30S ribosomal protein S20 [Christensenellaceae bacterium]